MTLPIAGWAREPVLWLDHDFDHDVSDSTLISPAGGIKSLYTTEDQSWQVSPIAASALSITKNSDGGRNGVYTAQSGAAVGNGFAVVWTGDTASITSGRVLAGAVYRWDWWVKTDGVSVANYELFAGLSDDWTARSAPTNASMISIDTSNSTTFFRTVVRSTSGNSGTISTRAYAANTWYKLSGIRTDSAWIFLVNDDVIVTDTQAFNSAPVIPGAACFVDTGGATGKIFSWDRCRVWTDGSNMVT